MNDLLLHELGARRVHWRYEDPSGVPDVGARSSRPRVHHRLLPEAEIRFRIRRATTSPKAA